MVRVVIIGTLAYLYNNANLLTGPRAYADINLSRRNVCQLSDNTEEDAVSGDVKNGFLGHHNKPEPNKASPWNSSRGKKEKHF